MKAWARVELAMTAEEFDETDPRDLASYWMAWNAKNQREEYRFATIVCTIGNLFRKQGDKPMEPADVFPDLPRASRARSSDELATKIRSVAATLGAIGEVGE